MKLPGLSLAALAATLFLAHGVTAQPPADRRPAPAPADAPARAALSTRAADLLQRFDKNADGRLDDTEVADARETMLQEQMARQAAQAARPNAEPFRQRLLELFDKNRDGRLDDEERAAARQYADERGLGENGEVREELLKRFDQNADGKLDDAERAALQRFLQERSGGRGQSPTPSGGKNEVAELEKFLRASMESSAAQMTRFDRNGDGKLDDAEWSAAREQLVRMLQGSEESLAGNSRAVDDRKRLEAVAAEVAKRRAMREKATREVGTAKP